MLFYAALVLFDGQTNVEIMLCIAIEQLLYS